MKVNFIILSAILGFSFLNAQVGIKTNDPKETLHVNGTARVSELPKNEEGKIYDGNSNKNKVFKGTRNVITDDDGNLGYAEFESDSKSAFGYANRCVKARWDKSNMQSIIGDATEITLDNIAVRYIAKETAWQSDVEIKTNDGQTEKVSYRPGGQSFKEIGPSFEPILRINYDLEGFTTGIIVLHNTGKMYRYSAMGWKETANTTFPGFCHSLEKIGEWDGVIFQ